MAYEIAVPTKTDARGALSIVDGLLPFDIKRAYWIYGCASQSRGGHRHLKTIQALVCVAGSCVIDWTNGVERGSVDLDRPDRILLLNPEDWHVMRDFSKDAVLLVFASEPFDADDYIDEGYEE